MIPQYCLWSAYRHANAEWKEEHEKSAAWARAARRTGIYEYYINGPWPGMHRLVAPHIAGSIKYLRRQGVDLYQTQSGDDFAINGVNYYVAAKLLWDTSLDERQILDDFYEKGFGNAAPAIRQFHGRLQEAWRLATLNGEDVSCGSPEKTRLPELFTPELFQKCGGDLAEAARLADNDLMRRRVDFYRQGLRYTELTVSAVEAAKRAALPAADPEKQKALAAAAPEAWEQRNRFVEEMKNDFVLSYFCVKYNDIQRGFNPTERLRELLKR